METPETLLGYWFGSHADDGVVAAERSHLWWSKDPGVDAEIRGRFEPWVQKAAGGDLSSWHTTPQGRLALILLTDQFPRNIYRDSGEAFAHDAKALAWCLDGLENGCDVELRPIQRTFFYLPLEHSESLEHQNRSLELFSALARSVPAPWQNEFEKFLEFAVRHRDIVERFGRFPHRNKLLGRESTPEEREFLKQAGSSF